MQTIKTIKTTLAALCLICLSLSLWAAPVTYPGPQATDTAGAVVSSGVSASVASVTDLDGNAIASPGAVAHVAGPNVSVVYDAAAKGEAWVGLTLTATSHTFSPVYIYCSQDPQTLVANNTLSTGIKAKTDQLAFDGSGYVNSHAKANDDKTGYSLSGTQNFNNTNTTIPGYWSSTTAPGYYTAPANPATVSLSSGDEAKLSNLDAAVSSRLAASAYTAPSNNQTGDAYALLASLLNVGRTAYTSTALANAPTGGGGSLTAPQVAAAVWDEPTAGHTTSGTFAPFLTGLPAATLTTIKADSLFALLLHSRKQLYNYVPSTHTLTLLNDDGTSTGLTVTLTVDGSGQITSRH